MGIPYKQVIAIQGPFSLNFNLAMIDEYRIDCIVTKQSGINGGFYEKFEAARDQLIDIVIIE